MKRKTEKLKQSLDLKDLNSFEKTEIENICAKYSDVFHLSGDKLTVTNLYKQGIQLKEGEQPFYAKPHRLPQAQKGEINKQISEMLENDIIEPSVSEWSSPILIVPKKAGKDEAKKWRVVIDYSVLSLSEAVQNRRGFLAHARNTYVAVSTSRNQTQLSRLTLQK